MEILGQDFGGVAREDRKAIPKRFEHLYFPSQDLAVSHGLSGRPMRRSQSHAGAANEFTGANHPENDFFAAAAKLSDFDVAGNDDKYEADGIVFAEEALTR
jgi:hypothetical protein